MTTIGSGKHEATSSSKSTPVDVAFTADARWHGVHPYNLDPNLSSILDHNMPKAFRYARELQSELAFIPPNNHPQKSPGLQFVVQQRGSGAVRIVNPTYRKEHPPGEVPLIQNDGASHDSEAVTKSGRYHQIKT